jgi:hypothetical protein
MWNMECFVTLVINVATGIATKDYKISGNNARTLFSRVSKINMYSGRKITDSLGNVTVRGEKVWKEQGGARWPTVCLSMYSITENMHYSQLSSVTLLLQPEPKCFTSYNTRKRLCSLFLRNGQQSSQLFCVHCTGNFANNKESPTV